MTAVPQFTGADRCQKWECALGAAIFLLLMAVSFSENRAPFHLASLISFFALISYCLKRFLKRKNTPPRFFVFVGLGLLMGTAGVLILLLSEIGLIPESWFKFGKLLYTQGMILALVLGVGTHLLPAIWGWSDLPIQPVGKSEESLKKNLLPVLGLAAALIFSFCVESTGYFALGQGIRAVLVSYLAVMKWNMLRKPKTRGRLSFWLWVSAWSLCLGLWLPLFFPLYAIHMMHFAFIGGFGLMTLMVASRVTLAHGGYGYRVEVRSRLLTTSAVLILISAATRLSAPGIPRIYLHHLAYAAIVWISAMLIWSVVLIPKMIRLKD